MDKLKMRCLDYSIWQIDKENLRKVAEFVVYTNYKHHQNNLLPENVEQEIEKVYEYEMKYFDYSLTYALKNDDEDILGTIRVMKWNGIDALPIQTDFNIKIENWIDSNADIWHIGRFAIDSSVNSFKAILHFKTLLAYAIAPICKDPDNVMFAECDIRLFATLKKLQINVRAIGESIYYLGSETIPILGDARGLYPFFQNNLLYMSIFSKTA